MTRGRLIAIEGSSGSGKSSIIEALLADPSFDLTPIKRVTTRERRANDPKEDQDYRFIPMTEFRRLVDSNAFVEYRDYLFGMSYGILKPDVEATVSTGHNALALTNLGKGGDIKRALLDAITIFVWSDPTAIEARLRERGQNTDEQIAERVENARKAVEDDHAGYDLVVENKDGQLADTIQEIDSFIRAELGSTEA
jgi:guanylate kinase